MFDQPSVQLDVAPENDLTNLVSAIETAINDERFQEALDIFSEDITSSWFALEPSRTIEIMRLLVTKAPRPTKFLHAGLRALTESAPGAFDSPSDLSKIDVDNPEEMLLLATLRLTDLRLKGHVTAALAQAYEMQKHLGNMRPLVDSHNGWSLLVPVQLGVSAMLAGNFTQALTNFTRAQMHAPLPKLGFLIRDSLVKSALIQACFGNANTAKALLQRSHKIHRTSSWVEANIDTHRDFAEVLVSSHNHEEAINRLESISLHDIGEMWPFYILAVHRILEECGYHDELEHRLEMFDAMPLPKVDGDGFSGSIIPLKRAMLAMKVGRGAEAQAFLDRADPRLPYSQLVQAAANVYAGRLQLAMQQVSQLRTETRGFRLMEIRRLSILAAAQFQAEEHKECIETLMRATEMPGKLTPAEAQLFSPETRELASREIPTWPSDNGGQSVFLTGLPRPGVALTDREIEITSHLANGQTRAQMAATMFISMNTLKSHLKSIYRKLGVSTAADAVQDAQRRGLIS